MHKSGNKLIPNFKIGSKIRKAQKGLDTDELGIPGANFVTPIKKTSGLNQMFNDYNNKYRNILQQVRNYKPIYNVSEDLISKADIENSKIENAFNNDAILTRENIYDSKNEQGEVIPAAMKSNGSNTHDFNRGIISNRTGQYVDLVNKANSRLKGMNFKTINDVKAFQKKIGLKGSDIDGDIGGATLRQYNTWLANQKGDIPSKTEGSSDNPIPLNEVVVTPNIAQKSNFDLQSAISNLYKTKISKGGVGSYNLGNGYKFTRSRFGSDYVTNSSGKRLNISNRNGRILGGFGQNMSANQSNWTFK